MNFSVGNYRQILSTDFSVGNYRRIFSSVMLI